VMLAFIASCNSNDTVNIPDDVLPKEKMADVMVDIHLLEATLNINAFNTTTASGKQLLPTVDILKKNKITKKQYEDSFYFYTNNPALLKEVYQLVLNKLSTMQAEVMNKK
jgi:hypothetical protein